jgi:threonine/homoserine/homoserine lactone efflux protein
VIEPAAWLQIGAVCLTGAASPGPSLAVVAKNTIEGGRLRGVATALGHGLGVGIYAALSVAGVSVVVAMSPGLHRLIEGAGGAYLLWMGASALRAGDAHDGHADSGRRGFADGFAIAFLNPKIAVFFLALLGSFLPPTAVLADRIGVAGLAGVIDAGWYVFAALVLAGTGAADWLRSRGRLVQRGLGVLLVGVGCGLIASALAGSGVPSGTLAP